MFVKGMQHDISYAAFKTVKQLENLNISFSWNQEALNLGFTIIFYVEENYVM